MGYDRSRSGKVSPSSHRWQFWGTVLTALITAGGAVFGSYLTVIKPKSEDAARAEVQRILSDRKPLVIGANTNPRENNGSNPVFVWGFCNGTRDSKDLEALVGETAQELALVQSASGAGRIAISFLVPPGWHYQVRHDAVEGVGCTFSGWYI